MLAAALRLVDGEGLDALTRRRLAQELDRDAMALYRHAPDRAALLDGLVALPMYGRAESLNLSTAAAVFLYASATAQHR